MVCLDEDSVLAFVDGGLDEIARQRAESHIARCSSCSDLVAAVAGGDPGAFSSEASAPPSRLARAATVGRYVILDLVGRGGMGEVYAAYDPQLDRKVALKLLHETAARGAAARIGRERLLREAKAIARLSHPNVVVVHDAGAIEDPGHGERVFLAMEFIDGKTLSAWLAAEPRSWRAIRDVFAAAGAGLAAAHEAGLVHRDFKPQNVMVAADGAVRVMDFGLASDVSASEAAGADGGALDPGSSEEKEPPSAQTVALTRTGVLLGTPLYMAPEQFLARPTDARTDQFSFCVALYEALYGERPFPSDSLRVLMDAVVAGRVRPPPQKVRVPAFLRKLLLRGLAAEPANRHPSMGALLEALRADPARRRRIAASTGTALLLALIAALGAARLANRGQKLCRGAGDKLAGIWELADSPQGVRRTAVHRAFLGTGRPFAEETWERVSSLLDDYGRRWTGMYTDTCEATHVRGDQSAEVLDLRMSCLEGTRAAFHALTGVLARSDPAVLVEAVNAAQALPPLERCSDVPALRAVVPPPDAATRGRVAALATGLAGVKALTDTGQWPEARRQVGPLVASARALGYQPLLAEALASLGWLENESGNPAAAEKVFEEAVWAAVAAHRDDIAVDASAYLMGITGYLLGRPDDSKRWELLADALLRRLGPGHERAAAWYYQDRASVSLREAHYRAALRDFEIALSLKRKILPPNHPDIARTLHSIANARNEIGDHRAALAAADQAVEIYRNAYGSRSPLLALPLASRGESFELLGRYAEAERDLNAAIDFSAALAGADHPWTAYPLTALGKALIADGHAHEAVAILERALRIREHADPNPEMVAETRFALARARWDADRDRVGALSLAHAARDAYRRLPAHAKHAEEVETWLADKPNKRVWN